MWPGFDWPKEPGLLARLLGKDSLDPILEYDRHIRGVLRTPDQMFAPCDFHRRKFIELGVPSDRIRTMAYGWPKGRLEGVAARRKPAARVRIGYIGSVIPTKGVHTLIDAFEGLDATKASLDIFGEIPPFHGDTTYADRIRSRASEVEGIRLHGRYENSDLPDILASIDVLVVPSVWYETFSITIREGFLAGVPVVASRLGAMGEAIDDGVTGLSFTHGDADDLREKLDRLVRDAELRARLVAAPKNVKGIEENAEEIAAIYRDLADRKKR
jgi:glycosyltransferase involved in cell wall biosynthesis